MEVQLQQRSEETLARIQDSAVRCFSIAGYTATSVDDICDKAGVSKGAFYHHFPSKQAVFLGLIDSWLGTIETGLKAARQETVPATLMHMTSLLPVIFTSAEGHLPMFLEFWLQASREEKVHQAMVAPYRHFNDYFTNLIRAGNEEGSLVASDPEVIAQAILSVAIGTLLQGLLDPNRTNWSNVAQESIQSILAGVIKSRNEDKE